MTEGTDIAAAGPGVSLSDGEEIAARFAANRAFAIHSSIALSWRSRSGARSTLGGS